MDERPYFNQIEKFLENIHDKKVESICMVALLDDPDIRDAIMTFEATPADLAMMGGIMQMHAAYDYMRINGENGEDDDEAW